MSSLKPQVALLVEEQYQVLEIWYPLLRLREEGYEVRVVGTGSREVYPSKEGYPVKVDIGINDLNAHDFDAVIIPGGWAPDFLRRFSQVNDFVKAMDQSGKIVAAICHGGWVLVSAQVLKNRDVTSFFAIKDDLIAAGGRWRDQEVVIDKNLITARKPDDLPAFVCAIIKQINALSEIS